MMRGIRTLLVGMALWGLSGAAIAAAIVPPSIPAGFTNPTSATSPLGSNLAWVTDFTAEYPFVNHFRMARPWFSGTAAVFQDDRPLDLDANGNVRSLLTGQVARTVLFTGLPADPGLSGRKFHIYYKGDGDISYGNVDVVSQSPGHDVIRLKTIASPDQELIAIFTLTRVNPTNPLRDVSLLPPGGICATNPLVAVSGPGRCPGGDYKSFKANHKSIVFNPAFLNGIKSYRSLRFMDWMRTNDSTQSAFTGRPLPSHQVWSTEKGVPLEVMIALANLMDIDPWFNIPHLASDAYVRNFAALLRDQLEPGRRAYIEYSNEVWNGQFAQTAYARAEGVRLGLHLPENDEPTGMVRFYSQRAQRIFDLFEQTLGGTNRIRRVMATQAVVPYFTETMLNFDAAAQKTDVFAIAPYFGDTIVDATKGDELKRLGVDGIFDWLFNDNNAILDFGSLPRIDRVVRDQVEVLAPFGIPLTSYEGGQHFLAAGSLFRDAELDALMDAVNRDPRMKRAYATYLGNWRRRTGQVFHHFVHCDRWSEFGRWGAKEYPTQPRREAPKLDAILSYITNRPL